MTDSDKSFVSSDRPSVDLMFPTSRLSIYSEFEDNRCSFATSSCSSEKQSVDLGSSYSAFSPSSQESGRLSTWSLQVLFINHFQVLLLLFLSIPTSLIINRLYKSLQDDVQAEMRRLKMELRYTMEMYSTACKEAITAKNMVINICT